VAARLESGAEQFAIAAERPIQFAARGHSETSTANRLPVSPQAAVGHRPPFDTSDPNEMVVADGANMDRASQAATGVLTAFPTSFHR
jgi:hypothetical protein